jgi:hypothetical protein
MTRRSKPPKKLPTRRLPPGPGISKIDAARQQLATAIQLYFEDRDPISTHTLAQAASEIIHALCKRKGSLRTLRDQILDGIIDPNEKDAIIYLLNEPSNFFKHASSKKSEQPLLYFEEGINFFAIWFAVSGLRILGEKLPEATAFSVWVSIVKPDLVPPPPTATVAIERLFGNIANKPRKIQKQAGLDILNVVRTSAKA